MRIPALLLLLLTAGLLGATAPALGQEPAGPVVAAEFAQTFPALLPMDPAPREHAVPAAAASGALGPDERVLVAATYWLLIGMLALRRVTRRDEPVPAPVSGWAFGLAPPVPR